MSSQFDQVENLMLRQYGDLLELLKLDRRGLGGRTANLYDLLNSPLVSSQKPCVGVPLAMPGGAGEHWQKRVEGLAAVGQVPKFQNEHPSLTPVIQELAVTAERLLSAGLRDEYDRVFMTRDKAKPLDHAEVREVEQGRSLNWDNPPLEDPPPDNPPPENSELALLLVCMRGFAFSSKSLSVAFCALVLLHILLLLQIIQIAPTRPWDVVEVVSLLSLITYMIFGLLGLAGGGIFSARLLKVRSDIYVDAWATTLGLTVIIGWIPIASLWWTYFMMKRCREVSANLRQALVS